VVSTPRDRAALAGLAGVHVVPNGVDLDAFPPGRGPREDGLVVFPGNLGYFPNVHGAAWLVREVWPRVRGAAPAARLRLVGARPARRLRRLLRAADGVAVAGPVDDLGAHLRAAGVAVAPIFAGSGQPLKVLEAMASGTPVVATPGAVAGLEDGDREHLLVAGDAGAFAAAIVRLLADPGGARRLAAVALDRVRARHTWARSAEGLEAVYRAALARPRPGRSRGSSA
jgi:glycosyltransferase involved in cell wall biosynthesis